MKPSIRLSLLAAAAGAAAGLLRLGLYRFGTDEKGLLITGHPLEIALWLLSAAAAVFVVLQVRNETDCRRYEANFPAGILSPVGCILFAAGLIATFLSSPLAFTTLELLRNIGYLLAAAALIAVAVCRKLGKHVPFGFHALVCVALILHTVSYYRIWSSHPQLMDAFFPMMGCILLMLFAYYQTAFDVAMGSRRMQLGTGLLAAVFCFAALPGSSTQLLYIAGGIWTLTNLCARTPAPEEMEESQ